MTSMESACKRALERNSLLPATNGERHRRLIQPLIGWLEIGQADSCDRQFPFHLRLLRRISERESTMGLVLIAKEVVAVCDGTKQAMPLDSSEIIDSSGRFGFFDLRIIGFDLFPNQLCNILDIHFRINGRQSIGHHR